MTDLEFRFALIYVAMWPVGMLLAIFVVHVWGLVREGLSAWFVDSDPEWRP